MTASAQSALRAVALIFLDTENAAALENSCLLAYIQHMRRDDVVAKLKETEPALSGFGIAALYLFGSHARDEADSDSDSDVDVFVDPASDRDFGFLPFMDAYETIQKAIGDDVEVGYSTRTGLSPISSGMSSGRRCGFSDGCQQEPPRPSASYSR